MGSLSHLVHPKRDEFADALAEVRREVDALRPELKQIVDRLVAALSKVQIPDHSEQLDRIEKMLEKGFK